MPKNLKIIGVVILTINLIIAINLLATKTFQNAQASQLQQNLQENQILELVNLERSKNGIQPLTINLQLTQSAQLKTRDMLDRNYFGHISNGGQKWSDFIIKSGYNYTISGENLAKNYTDSRSTVQAWMNSTTHRDNILNKDFEETGIALSGGMIDNQSTILITQQFGSQP